MKGIAEQGANSEPRRRRRSGRISDVEIGDLCRRLLGQTPVGIERPGGRSRQSVRVLLRDRSIVVTRRKYPARAALEAAVMAAMNREDAPVPELLAFDQGWLLQEDLGGVRLSQALAEATPADADALLRRAVDALVATQAAAMRQRVRLDLVVLGEGEAWRRDLVRMPLRIGRHFDLPPPDLPVEKLVAGLAAPAPHFVKWDARPGNAIVRPDGRVFWIDWEHCGLRNPLDDMAWLLGDEFTPFEADLSAPLLMHAVRRVQGELGRRAGLEDLLLFGTFHTCVRLGLVLANKEDGPWWEAGYCLERDKVGVTREMALRLCRRGRAWADGSALTRPLASWFDAVAEALPGANPA